MVSGRTLDLLAPFAPIPPAPSAEQALRLLSPPSFLVTDLEGEFWSESDDDEGDSAPELGDIEEQLRNALAAAHARLTNSSSFKLKPLQVKAVQAALRKRDIFLRLPTGFGKTLCFEAAALLDWVASGKRRTTVVVSPLLSLINDQVAAAQARGIDVAEITGNSKSGITHLVSTSPDEEKPVLVFVTPDQLARFKVATESGLVPLGENVGSEWSGVICEGNLARFVIDEVHVLEHWGDSFRPVYKVTENLRRAFPSTPITVATATCPPELEDSITARLRLRHVVRIYDSAHRPNLFYSVVAKATRKLRDDPNSRQTTTDRGALQIADHIKRQGLEKSSGLIYCRKTEEARRISAVLVSLQLSSATYFAEMNHFDKERFANQWHSGEVKILCCTEAFGLGINKPDVRFVFHSSLPKSMSAYHQESGRAGRDGQLAFCTLFYQFQDVYATYKASNCRDAVRKDVNKVLLYCLDSVHCRGQQLLHHLGEHFADEDCEMMCDNCRCEGKSQDVSADCLQILKVLAQREASPYSTQNSKRLTITEFIKQLPGTTSTVQRKALMDLLIAKDFVRLVSYGNSGPRLQLELKLGPNSPADLCNTQLNTILTYTKHCKAFSLFSSDVDIH